MASISLIFRPSTKQGDHPGRLCLRIIHRRMVRSSSTPYLIYRHEWDSKNQQIAHPNDNTKRSDYLQEVEEKLADNFSILQKIIDSLEEQGRYEVEDIMNNYRLHKSTNKLLYYVEKLILDLNRLGQERTARAYHTVAKGLIKFNKGKDIPLKHINACLIKEFELDMKQKGKTLNTISFYMRNLRAIYNKAVSDKHIAGKIEPPFGEVYTGIQKTRKRALSLDEIKCLHEFDLSSTLSSIENHSLKIDTDAGLIKAKQLFFFCFHARGMSFVDMAYLRKENIRGGLIRYYRKKTGGMIELKITTAMQQIINNFAHEMANSPYVFPILQNQGKPLRLQYESALRVQNRRLKKLAKLANIGRGVSTHVARHSWASIAKKENLPLWVISEGLGHSSEKVTYTYLASLDRSVLDKANELITSTVIGII